MITMTPLPQWKHLLTLPFVKGIDEQTLAKPWLRENDHAFFFSKTAWSLKAIVLWVEYILKINNPTIFIPDYFCNQSLSPLRSTSAQIIFYPVDHTMQPNWERCTQLALSTPPNVFLLVHYFGQPSAATLAKNFCKPYHSLLVEDAAHVLTPIHGIGEHGSFVLYSPHKLLAIPDGALCIMHRVPKCTTHEIAIATMNRIQHNMGVNTPSCAPWIIKRIIQKLIPRAVKTVDFNHVHQASYPNTPKISLFSKKLLQQNLSSLTEVAEKRNYYKDAWNFLTSGQDHLTPSSINETIVPYMGVYQGEPANKTKEIYRQLQQNDWPVATWPDLPPEISNNASCYHEANLLRSRVITLPTHHTLSLNKLTKQYFKHTLYIKENFHIRWDINYDEWEALFSKINRSNLLQSWHYGCAKAADQEWEVKRSIIYHDHKPIALCQCLEKKLPLIGKIIRINRGPIFVEDYQSPELLLSVYHLLLKQYGWKKGKLLLIAPELQNTVANKIQLKAIGLYRRGANRWHSSWINLQQSTESLRSSLNGSWRNRLKSAEKHNLHFQIQQDEDHLSWLLSQYKTLQIKKGFKGIPDSLLKKLYQLDHKNFYILRLLDENSPIAACLIITHGTSCTYIIGWSGDLGRQYNAMNLLFWHTFLLMKEKGISWFDLGGLDDDNNKSVAQFKRGMNGSEYSLLGEYYFI